MIYDCLINALLNTLHGYVADRQEERETGRRTDGQTDRRTDGQTDTSRSAPSSNQKMITVEPNIVLISNHLTKPGPETDPDPQWQGGPV